jgi:hypothetical protein
MATNSEAIPFVRLPIQPRLPLLDRQMPRTPRIAVLVSSPARPRGEPPPRPATGVAAEAKVNDKKEGCGR